jgi:glycosyltransferase involved in cell wall biosynthesis
MLRASVIITTHNRPDFLKACLNRLCNQSISMNDYELIVVDSCSYLKSENKKVISRIESKYGISINYKYNFINGGITHSKNLAITMAASENIVVADDDSLPGHTYIQAAIDGLNKSDLVIGRMTANYEVTPTDILLKNIKTNYRSGFFITDFTVIDLGDSELEIPQYLAFASNCAFKKSFYFKAGGLGPDGFSYPYLYWNGSGEHNYSAKATRVLYLPKMHAEHCILGDRLTLKFFKIRSHFYGISESFSIIKSGKHPLFSLIFMYRFSYLLFCTAILFIKGDRFSSSRSIAYLNGFLKHQYYAFNNKELINYCRLENWFDFDFSKIKPLGNKENNSQWSILDERK